MNVPIPEREGGSIVYRASSPDEEALIKAARELGVVFMTRTPDYVAINVVCWKRERERERGMSGR